MTPNSSRIAASGLHIPKGQDGKTNFLYKQVYQKVSCQSGPRYQVHKMIRHMSPPEFTGHEHRRSVWTHSTQATHSPWTPVVAQWMSPGQGTESAFPRTLNGDISPSPEVISHFQVPPAPTFCYNLGNALGSSFFFFCLFLAAQLGFLGS